MKVSETPADMTRKSAAKREARVSVGGHHVIAATSKDASLSNGNRDLVSSRLRLPRRAAQTRTRAGAAR
jgi:hypothetical protein